MNRSNNMARRYGNGAKASAANVQAIETIIGQVGCAFVPKQDPFRELAMEIEKCSRKVWQCVGDRDASDRQVKKARTNKPEAPVPREPVVTEIETVMPNMVTLQPKVGGGGESRLQIEARINAMKYRDIQVECKQYGLLAMGNKEVLRERLLAHLLEEKSQANVAQADGDLEIIISEPMQEESGVLPENKADSSNSEDVIMQDEAVDVPMEKENIATFEPFENVVDIPPARVSCSSVQAPAETEIPFIDNELHEEKLTEKMVVDHTSKDPPGKAMEDSAPSVGPEDFGSRSPLAGFVKDALKSMVYSVQKANANYSDSIPEDDVSPPPSDVTSSTTSSKISGARVRELVSKLSNPPNSNSNSNSNSALSKSVQAKKEARMARMAEMRGKSQQAKIFSASKVTEHTSTLALAPLNSTIVSASKTMSTSSSTSNTKKNLAQQMREKALRKENVPANHMHSVNPSGSAIKHTAPLSYGVVTDSLGSTLKSGLGATLKYGLPSANKTKSPPKPSETYEISDREDSDSDDSEAENEKRKKQIPSWAKKEQLYAALEAQYGCVDGQRVDPDLIFSEVDTCNLEAIFGNKMNTKYRNRTSSGNWSRDQVTAAEKLVYKRAMGFGTVETSEI